MALQTNAITIRNKNLLDSAQALILACRKIGVDPEDPTNRVSPETHLDRHQTNDAIYR